MTGFPWETLPRAALVVDVGGGSGRWMFALREHFAHLKYIVQDARAVCSQSIEVRASIPSTTLYMKFVFSTSIGGRPNEARLERTCQF